jgi:hypothetical protein
MDWEKLGEQTGILIDGVVDLITSTLAVILVWSLFSLIIKLLWSMGV